MSTDGQDEDWLTQQPVLSHDLAFGTPGHRAVLDVDAEDLFDVVDWRDEYEKLNRRFVTYVTATGQREMREILDKLADGP